ncbi:MAG: hypothetical protein H7Y00_09515 [Fimbriimonadaceae bacterium]|nr:hypothetical protein [Chitinophagales bacterium]
MKLFIYLLLFCTQSLFAQKDASITLKGTPQSENERKDLEKADTIFVFSKYALPDSIIPCDKITTRMYPDQQKDDYLHEERFEGMYHVVLFDHIVTRKMLNVFLKTLDDPNANLCGVQLILTNPNTGQVVVFNDIFNWVNNNGKQIFNVNRELKNLWNFSGGAVAFPVKLIHTPTGRDYTFGHSELRLVFRELGE